MFTSGGSPKCENGVKIGFGRFLFTVICANPAASMSRKFMRWSDTSCFPKKPRAILPPDSFKQGNEMR